MATLAEVLEYNEENDFYPVEALTAFYENMGSGESEPDEICQEFEDSYVGTHDSLEDYAYELVDSCGDLGGCPEYLRNYFDYKSFGRDLELGGDIWVAQLVSPYAIAVFRNV